MMKKRSIIITTIFLFFLLHVSNSREQFKADSIISEKIVLEARHFSYIYDFALNSAVHQYASYHQSRLISDYPHPVLSSNSAFIVADVLPMDFKLIKRFIYPDTTGRLDLVEGAHSIIFADPFVSQYELEVLSEFGMDTLRNLPIFSNTPAKDTEPQMAIVFSNLYQRQKSFYIMVGLANHTVRTFSSITSWAHIFEFEWCESVNLVYPRRVSAPYFHSLPISSKRVVEIPSLPCYPPRGDSK